MCSERSSEGAKYLSPGRRRCEKIVGHRPMRLRRSRCAPSRRGLGRKPTAFRQVAEPKDSNRQSRDFSHLRSPGEEMALTPRSGKGEREGTANPGLAPWATLFRSFGADLCRNFGLLARTQSLVTQLITDDEPRTSYLES